MMQTKIDVASRYGYVARRLTRLFVLQPKGNTTMAAKKKAAKKAPAKKKAAKKK
jgi:hypothetical protein